MEILGEPGSSAAQRGVTSHNVMPLEAQSASAKGPWTGKPPSKGGDSG
jgi:hypothetical protein